MSDRQKKLDFGRDAAEFLQELESESNSLDNVRSSDGGIYIVSISAPDGERVTVRVLVENAAGSEEIEFCLLSELAEELRLAIGEINGEAVTEIEHFAEVTRAYFSACSSFAFVESSLRALERKLLQKGFAKDIARQATELVSVRGFVNECEIARNRVRVFLGKGWGKNRIYSKLRQEGFGDPAIECVRIELDKADLAEDCASVIRRKFGEIPSDRREREKMYASLSRLGYSSSEIREALKILSQDE